MNMTNGKKLNSEFINQNSFYETLKNLRTKKSIGVKEIKKISNF